MKRTLIFILLLTSNIVFGQIGRLPRIEGHLIGDLPVFASRGEELEFQVCVTNWDSEESSLSSGAVIELDGATFISADQGEFLSITGYTSSGEEATIDGASVISFEGRGLQPSVQTNSGPIRIHIVSADGAALIKYRFFGNDPDDRNTSPHETENYIVRFPFDKPFTLDVIGTSTFSKVIYPAYLEEIVDTNRKANESYSLLRIDAGEIYYFAYYFNSLGELIGCVAVKKGDAETLSMFDLPSDLLYLPSNILYWTAGEEHEYLKQVSELARDNYHQAILFRTFAETLRPVSLLKWTEIGISTIGNIIVSVISGGGSLLIQFLSALSTVETIQSTTRRLEIIEAADAGVNVCDIGVSVCNNIVSECQDVLRGKAEASRNLVPEEVSLVYASTSLEKLALEHIKTIMDLMRQEQPLLPDTQPFQDYIDELQTKLDTHLTEAAGIAGIEENLEGLYRSKSLTIETCATDSQIYMLGESVILTVNVTDHSGQPIDVEIVYVYVFDGDERVRWQGICDFSGLTGSYFAQFSTSEVGTPGAFVVEAWAMLSDYTPSEGTCLFHIQVGGHLSSNPASFDVSLSQPAHYSDSFELVNTSSAPLNINVVTYGEISSWIDPEGDSFTLNGLSQTDFAFHIDVPSGVAENRTYHGGIYFTYLGGDFTVPVVVHVISQGPELTSNAYVDGDYAPESPDPLNPRAWTDGHNFNILSGVPYQDTFDELTTDDFDRLIYFQNFATINKISGGSGDSVCFKLNDEVVWYASVPTEMYPAVITEQIRAGTNSYEYGIYNGGPETEYLLDYHGFQGWFSKQAWAVDRNYSQDLLDDWKAGWYSGKLQTEVITVHEDGIVYFYLNGKEIYSRYISSSYEGKEVTFGLEPDEADILSTSNRFNLKGCAGPVSYPDPRTHAKVDFGPIHFDVTYFSGVPSLTVEKEVSKNPILVGDETVLTITLTNIGTNVARSANYSDPLPAGLQLVNGSLSNGDTLIPSESVSFQYTVRGITPAVYTLPAVDVEYDDPLGNEYHSLSSSATLEVQEATILTVVSQTNKTDYSEGETVQLSVSVTNESGPVNQASIEWKLSAGAESFNEGHFLTGPDGTGMATFSAPVQPGVYTIDITTSKQNCETRVDSVPLTVLDSTPPVVPTILFPAKGSSVPDTKPDFTWTVSEDTASGVANYIVQVDTDPCFLSPIEAITMDANHVFATALTEDVYFWRVKAVDNSQNSSIWSTVVEFDIDTSLPSIQITNPTSEVSYTTTDPVLTFGGMCGDPNNSNLDRVYLVNQSNGYAGWDYSISGSSSSWSVEDVTLDVGDNNVIVVAYDRAGNSANENILVERLEGLIHVEIKVSPAGVGLELEVDGIPYTEEETFIWDPGSQHVIAVISPQLGDDRLLHTFTHWSDSGAGTHTIAPLSDSNFIAYYDTSFPTGSLRVVIEPHQVRSIAQWRLTSGPDPNWHDSGDTIATIPAAVYTLEFSEVTGWTRPPDEIVTIEYGTYEITRAYLGPPTPQTIAPANGPPGSYVKLEGEYFGDVNGTVRFDGSPCPEILSWDANEIICRVPWLAMPSGVIPVEVVRSGNIVSPNSLSFTLTDPNTIYVDKTNTSGTENGTFQYPFSTIQRGIEAATTNDEVVVAADIYVEDVVGNVRIDLHFAGDSTIDGQLQMGSGNVLSDGSLTITGNASLASNVTTLSGLSFEASVIADGADQRFEALTGSFLAMGTIIKTNTGSLTLAGATLVDLNGIDASTGCSVWIQDGPLTIEDGLDVEGNLKATGVIHLQGIRNNVAGDIMSTGSGIIFDHDVIADGFGSQVFDAGSGKLIIESSADMNKSTAGSLTFAADAGIELGGNVTGIGMTSTDSLIFRNSVTADGSGEAKDQRFDARLGVLSADSSITKITAGKLNLGGDEGIELGGNLEIQEGDLTFEDAVITNGFGSQEFVTEGGTLTSEGTITKTTAGDLYLYNDGHIDLNGTVEVENGSFISRGVDFDNTGADIITIGGNIIINHTGIVTLGADFDPKGGTLSGTVTKVIVTPTGKIQDGIDVASNYRAFLGRMYWLDLFARKIQRANLDGTAVEDLITGLSFPRGIALDVVGGKMYWTDSGPGKILRAGLDGTAVEDLVTGLSAPYGIALDIAGDKMYWIETGTNKIRRANLDGTAVENLVFMEPSVYYGIALDIAGGKMYWTGIGKIQRANLDGTAVEDLVTGGTPFGITLDIAGEKMYWTNYSAGKIQRANLDGTVVENLVTDINSPSGIALDVVGGKIYWTDLDLSKIQRANLDGTVVEGLVTGLDRPLGIALNVVASHWPEVLVMDGTYIGPDNRDIDFRGKVLTLHSENGPESCIIDCNGSESDPHRGFYFHSGEDANCVLTGFTITNGYAYNGGGIYCYGSSPTITHCIITNNSIQYSGGGGIKCSTSSNPLIKDCIIVGNSAENDGEGGGIYCEYDSSPIITNCTIKNNWSHYNGGGIHCTESSNPTVSTCIIANNTSEEGSGGGTFCWESNLSISDCNINGNSSEKSGGGLFADRYSTLTLINCIFSDNSAGDYGGGISCWKSNAELINCIISNNLAAYFGGGLLCYKSSNLRLTDCTFSDNIADPQISGFYQGFGGGANYIDSNATLTNCAFYGNSAKIGGGGIADYNSISTLTDCTFNGNSAEEKGGGMYNEVSSPILRNCTFRKNCCLNGNGGGINNLGGIYNLNSDSFVIGCVIEGNKAGDNGGGVYFGDSNGIVNNTLIIANSVDSSGGGIYSYRSRLEIINCTIVSNTAKQSYAVIAHSEREFSGTQGQDGWYYGYYNSPFTSSNFNEMEVFDDWDWHDGSYSYILSKDDARPSSTEWVVRRWISDVTGEFSITGNLAKSIVGMDANDGMTGYIIVDGNEVWNSYIEWDDTKGVDYSINIHLEIGSVIDFAIGLYTGNGENWYGEMDFVSIIKRYFNPSNGGGVFGDPNGPNLNNCILWDNSCNGDTSEPSQIYSDTPIISYSCIQGLTGFLGGLGNIGIDPCFVEPGYWGDVNDPNIIIGPNDPNAFWIDGDYHLLPDSLCIDAGDPNYSTDFNDIDLGGNPRVVGGRIDMGAYEYSPERLPDLNGDGIVNFKDYAILVYYWMEYICEEPEWCEGSDLNKSGAVDVNDLAIFVNYWLEERPIPFYSNYLDADPRWITTGEWAYGQPTGSGGNEYGNPDPMTGYTGTNVYGVNLNGDYSTVVGGPYYVTTEPVDCSGYRNVKLKFARWLNTDESGYVKSTIEVSNGGPWITVWEHTDRSHIIDNSWRIVEYDISSIADGQETVYIRWNYEILQDAYPYSGWNIDDIELWGNPMSNQHD